MELRVLTWIGSILVNFILSAIGWQDKIYYYQRCLPYPRTISSTG